MVQIGGANLLRSQVFCNERGYPATRGHEHRSSWRQIGMMRREKGPEGTLLDSPLSRLPNQAVY
ncbi:MAG TPA: hypothetical protein VN729_03585 [Ktedonobacteraceae bacterium]|nr:hypothetical protein [Ktedonobacteraceae bacterium]